jgi:DNA polymerase
VTVAKVIDGLIDQLRLQQENGIRTIEADPALVAALTASAPIFSPSSVVLSGDLSAIAARVATCTQCGLCKTRQHTVPGQGASKPELIFVGEGPGADEDAQGLAFVGRAGQLLTKIIEAMGLTREEVWIGNIVKCRPPNNRVPTPEEMQACMPYLREQIALLQPKVMVCLGATAVKGLLDPAAAITKVRGNWMKFEGIDVMPTFHPAYLLRNPPAKREVWEDMKAVLQRLGRAAPAKRS